MFKIRKTTIGAITPLIQRELSIRMKSTSLSIMLVRSKPLAPVGLTLHEGTPSKKRYVKNR